MTPRTGWSLCTAIATLVVVVAVFSARQAHPADPCSGPATTILVVRHADRTGDADSLSAAGRERAQDLVGAVRNAHIAAIYHSDTRRTRDTAMPVAQALHITPEEYPAKEVKPLIERILRDHAGEAVLVVGHSNTIPMIIAAAQGPLTPGIDEKEFDGLFILTVPRCRGTTILTTLQYGEPSP